MSGVGNSGERNEAIASGVIAADVATASDAIQLQPQAHNKFLVMQVSSRTDGTFIPKVQHSVDGSVWEDLVAGTGLSANGMESIPFPITGNLPYVRAVVTSSVTTTGATIAAFFVHANPIR
jgi:hypothetical protein